MFIDFTDEQKALREELQGYYTNLITPEIHELQKLEEGTGPVRRKLVEQLGEDGWIAMGWPCLLYTSPSPRDRTRSRMPSSA